MANKIQFKRGTADPSASGNSIGEPLFRYDDTNSVYKLFVASSNSAVKWVGAPILDQDTLSSDSATSLATQQSIKAYVDAQVDTADALSELADTDISTPADASLLLYDTGTSTWRDGAMSGDATIDDVGAFTIANDAVSNAKLANIAQGSVKVGGGSNAPTDLDAKTSGRILVGDGTDIVSVAVSGDVTLASNGAVTIGNDKIDSQHYAAVSIDNEHLADNAVDSDELASGSVDDGHLSDGVAAGLAGTGLSAAVGVLSIDAAQAITSVSGDFTVDGNLIVSGTSVTTNVETVEIEDPMVRLATSNAADTYDMGMYGKYVATGAKYAGIYRDVDVTGDPWTFFDSLTSEPPTTGNVVGPGANGFNYAPIRCADITGSGATSGNGTLSGFDIDGGTWA
jgi:hypothetical protein